MLASMSWAYAETRENLIVILQFAKIMVEEAAFSVKK